MRVPIAAEEGAAAIAGAIRDGADLFRLFAIWDLTGYVEDTFALAQTARDIGAGGGIVFDNKQFHRVLM